MIIRCREKQEGEEEFRWEVRKLDQGGCLDQYGQRQLPGTVRPADPTGDSAGRRAAAGRVS